MDNLYESIVQEAQTQGTFKARIEHYPQDAISKTSIYDDLKGPVFTLKDLSERLAQLWARLPEERKQLSRRGPRGGMYANCVKCWAETFGKDYTIACRNARIPEHTYHFWNYGYQAAFPFELAKEAVKLQLRYLNDLGEKPNKWKWKANHSEEFYASSIEDIGEAYKQGELFPERLVPFVYVAMPGLNSEEIISADMDENAWSYDFWEEYLGNLDRAMDLEEQGGDWEIVTLENVPEDIANALCLQDSTTPVYKDGFEAYKKAKKYMRN